MSAQNPSDHSSSTDSIGTPMTNNNTNETRPYPDNDPMRDLLDGPTTPTPDGTQPRSAQDAMTTESFDWTTAPAGTGTDRTEPVGASAAAGDGPPHAPRDAGAGNSRVATETNAQTNAQTNQPTPARAGTIVWGCVLFLIAALAAVPAVLGEAVLTPVAILWIVVGFGTLLVVGGIIGAIVRASTRNSRAERTRTY
jgi:hypothetical protein